jgi:putative membrane protein
MTVPDAVGAPAGDVPPVDDAPPADEVPWRRLSVRMLAVHPVREVLRAWPVLIGVLFLGTRSGVGGGLWGLIGVGFVVVMGLMRWFTTTYRISAEQVQVRRGLLRRETLTVPRDRVRTVDITASPLHRVLGLALVTVGTGRTDRKNDGLKLDALTAEEAGRLRVELLDRSTAAPATVEGVPAPPPTPEIVLAELRPGWLRFAPFSLSGLVTVAVTIGFLFRLANEAKIQVDQLGPVKDATDELSRTAVWLAVVQVAIVFLIIVAIFSTVAYVVAYYGFRLTRQPGGTLHIVRGLLTRRSITIEERRLRGTELSEPLPLRLAGGARTLAIATGLRVGRGAERGGSLLVPPAPRAEAQRVAGDVLRDVAPVRAPLTRHGTRARLRRYTRALLGTGVIVGVLAALWWLVHWPSWPVTVALFLIPVAVLLAEDRYRNLGHALVGDTFVVRQGSLVRRRNMLVRDGIIGFNFRQSLFQRRAGVVTVEATTAGGRQRYVALDVPAGLAAGVADAAVPGLLTPFLRDFAAYDRRGDQA